MESAMDSVRVLVDSSTVVGEPIVTPDSVTVMPVSRVSFGYAAGGNDKSASPSKPTIWGGSGGAVKIEPVGFLMIKEGSARMVSIQPPALTTADRVLDMIPEIMEKLEGYVDKYGKKSGKSDPLTGNRPRRS